MTPEATPRERLEALAQKVPVRVAAALLCMAVHLGALIHSGRVRFDAPWNDAPGEGPAYIDPASDANPQRWNRLVVSRWDAGQYVSLGLRGYQYCPPKGEVPRVGTRTCNLVFYPSYGFLGSFVRRLTGLAIDYSLFAISVVSAFIFLFMWTGPALTRRLGVTETWLSFLLFNTFTTGFTLMTVQTEPLTLALTLGSFVAFTRKQRFLAAFLAGAGSCMRITGVATGAACGLAILVEAWQERPLERRQWVARFAAALLSGWGALALSGYHWVRFGDPLTYIHAHGASFKHEVSFWNLLSPRPEWIVHAIEQPLHEGVWLVLGILWFALGHRKALGRFPLPERVFWYTVYLGIVAIAAFGQVAIFFQGMNRYLLLALPLFFSMAAVLRRRPVALVFWLIVSVWHYWQIDICTYTGGMGDHVLDVCHTPHWMGRI